MTPDEAHLIAHLMVKGKEGFYSDDPGDPGGETLYGLSRVHHPEAHVWAAVDAYKASAGFPESMRDDPRLKKSIFDHFKKKWWFPLACDQIHSLKIQCELYDAGVNIGTKYVGLYAQLVLNTLNKDEKLFEDLKLDGKPGKLTADAVNAVTDRTHGEEIFYLALNGWQAVYYAAGKEGVGDLIEKFKSGKIKREWSEKYQWGWFRHRVVSFTKFDFEIQQARRELGL